MARSTSVRASIARSHSVSKPMDRLFRLDEPIRISVSSTTMVLEWIVTGTPAGVTAPKMANLPKVSALRSRSTRWRRARPISSSSSQPGQFSGVTTTISGPSGSPSRDSRACPTHSAVKYWLSM